MDPWRRAQLYGNFVIRKSLKTNQTAHLLNFREAKTLMRKFCSKGIAPLSVVYIFRKTCVSGASETVKNN